MIDQDFPLRSTGEAVPDGIYDLQAKSGWLGLGLSADSPCFAAACLAAWRATVRNCRYPRARQLPVLADSGASNRYRPRARNLEFAGGPSSTAVAL